MVRAPKGINEADLGWWCVRGVAAGARAVLPYQRGLIDFAARSKEGPTVTWVGAADMASQVAIVEELLPFGLPIMSEEAKKLFGARATLAEALSGWMPRSDQDMGNIWLIDPFDGTRKGREGDPGSTIIASVYSRRLKQVVATATIYPTTGVVVFTYQGKTFMLTLDTNTWKVHRDSKLVECRVSLADLGKAGTVRIEHSWEHVREDLETGGPDRPVLNNAAMRELILGLLGLGCLDINGSNGANAITLARGLNAGWICTAVGGPHDLGGLLAVKNAGGSIRGMRVWFRDGQVGITMSPDPLDVMRHDMALGANTEHHANLLVERVEAAIASMRRN